VEEQRKEKLEKERKALIEKQEENKRKDRDLTLREQNAKAFQQQTKSILNEKAEEKIKLLNREKQRIERELKDGFSGQWGDEYWFSPEEKQQRETRLKEINTETQTLKT
jgi:Fe-S cluster assembly ATPase SufC